MKKILLLMCAAVISLTACNTNTEPNKDPIAVEGATVITDFDATSTTTWHYYNFEKKEFIGKGERAEDAAWAKRTDWDMAICRYKVKTNSGTSGAGKGGLHTTTAGEKFETYAAVPKGASFIQDITTSKEQMDESILTESHSTAVVSVMEGMPPTWLKAPLYVMPSADGQKFYKVDFLRYKNATGVSGMVTFQFADVKNDAPTTPVKPIPEPETKVSVKDFDATSTTTWHYYSFKEKKFIGAGEAGQDDAAWAKRTDWDMAINRYKVKTNSGKSGIGKGGLYTSPKDTVLTTLKEVPADAVFVRDMLNTNMQMDQTYMTESRSTAVVAVMVGMPPVWKKSPIHVMPSADGETFYKVEFLSYKDAKGTSGMISFDFDVVANPTPANNDVPFVPETVITDFDATSTTAWHYYSLVEKKFIGKGERTEDAEWAKRTDWDIAVCRYKVRTNSGTSGLGKSGLYTTEEGVTFESFVTLAEDAVFTADIEFTDLQMDDSYLTESRSTARVALMTGMPPTWLKTPLYIVPSADGNRHYKVDFIRYKNDAGASGNISFQFDQFIK